MAIQEKLYTVDDVWELSHRPENHDKYYYLIDGELHWDMPPGGEHGDLAGEIIFRFKLFAKGQDLGKFTVETGYYPPESRHTVLARCRLHQQSQGAAAISQEVRADDA